MIAQRLRSITATDCSHSRRVSRTGEPELRSELAEALERLMAKPLAPATSTSTQMPGSGFRVEPEWIDEPYLRARRRPGVRPLLLPAGCRASDARVARDVIARWVTRVNVRPRHPRDRDVDQPSGGAAPRVDPAALRRDQGMARLPAAVWERWVDTCLTSLPALDSADARRDPP